MGGGAKSKQYDQYQKCEAEKVNEKKKKKKKEKKKKGEKKKKTHFHLPYAKRLQQPLADRLYLRK